MLTDSVVTGPIVLLEVGRLYEEDNEDDDAGGIVDAVAADRYT